MLSRALSLATVTLLVGCLTAGGARAENLDAGKSPSQIFSSTCSACHKSPRGLLKNTPASSLPGFLRQHYTTGSDMASVLSSYLISNGAADPKYQSKDQAKKDARQKDAKQDARPDQPERFGRRQQPAPAQDASRPDAEAAPPQGEGRRRGRDRVARPRAAPEAANPPDGQAPPVRAATDSKSDVKQKRGRRAKPAAVEEPPKSDADEPIRIESPKEDVSRDVIKPETSAVDPGKTDAIKRGADKPDSEATKPAVDSDRPSRDVKSDSAKVDPSSSSREGVGNDPAPPATATTAPEPDANSSAAPSPASPSSVEATAPASPPVSSGPPAPPISR
jgi:hypothetical protein